MTNQDGRARVLAALRDDFSSSSRGSSEGSSEPDRLPLWLMRQAGRFLPEYRAVRADVPFLDLVRSPDLCTEVALQPLRRFDLDATIVFSDILVIPDALGAGLSFEKGDGPKIERPLVSDAAVDALAWDGVCDRLGYVYDAVAALRKAAPGHALFGFAGSPWTLFCYLTQGAGGGEFATARAALWAHPERSRRVLEQLTDAVIEHLVRQARAGADVVQVFDTWGGLLPAADYEKIAAPGLRRIAKRLAAERIPSVFYVRAGAHLVDVTRTLGFSALSVDSTVDLARFAASPGRASIPTQGNLDNTRLLGGRESIAEGVARIGAALGLHQPGGRRNHIVNLGHGILPSTPPDAVSILVEEVRRLG
ncbi:MAG: uroporphyrinogen decarboxylase [Pseudomonadota bacterium]|nr:uroporphyrinogen decarboxylase [Pseudomonadota bacterium]